MPLGKKSIKNKSKYKWVEPRPTKSGRNVMDIWNDLKRAWRSYKMYYYIRGDKINAVIKAKQIRKLQEDLGVKKDKFHELGVFE